MVPEMPRLQLQVEHNGTGLLITLLDSEERMGYFVQTRSYDTLVSII
jgi:hypothetical protein